MDYRQLGGSGLKVPVISFGCGTFGGRGNIFKAWGETNAEEATRIVDICLENGVSLFDTADMYSKGQSEVVLGQAISGRRSKVLISTKATFRFEEGPNDVGSSRYHLVKSCEESIKRLKVDYIDLYYMHGFDALTPIDETLRALDDLISSGKIRYIGCSNFSGWHLMKSLSISERYGLEKYCAYQGYYSLVGRDYEWELMPLCLDQKVGTVVWSPLGWGRLTGKIDRNNPKPPKVSRLHETAEFGPPVDEKYLYDVIDVIREIGRETGKSVTQIALNWLMQRPTVSSVVIGARNEEQLRENLGSIGWNLTPDQISRLDKVSKKTPIYPYWHQRGFAERIPLPCPE